VGREVAISIRMVMEGFSDEVCFVQRPEENEFGVREQ
jgi:hypothetical protein